MHMSFERLMALHCAPALAGVKPANMFTWHGCGRGEQNDIMRQYKARLKPCGINMEELCRCEKYTLVFIYRKLMLESHLDLPEARDILSANGYDTKGSLRSKVSVLKEKLRHSKIFPHEIGLFLGYPAEDVKGFIANKGDGCKFCGSWKVYGDRERAVSAFKLYDYYRDFFCNELSNGNELTEIIHSVQNGRETEAWSYE